MDLCSTFICQDWKIKYSLQEPERSQESPSATKATVVFVHGTPWSSDVFQPIAKALLASKQYRVLLYDLPGYGQSQVLQGNDANAAYGSKFIGDTSVRTQAAVLAELLKHLELDGKDGRTSAAVIAHDIAGAIALRAHLIHDCEFRSLMLLDTNAVLPGVMGFTSLCDQSQTSF